VRVCASAFMAAERAPSPALSPRSTETARDPTPTDGCHWVQESALSPLVESWAMTPAAPAAAQPLPPVLCRLCSAPCLRPLLPRQFALAPRVCWHPGCQAPLCHECLQSAHVCSFCDGDTQCLCPLHPVPTGLVCVCGTFHCQTLEACRARTRLCAACWGVACNPACVAQCNECEADLFYHRACLVANGRLCLEHFAAHTPKAVSSPAARPSPLPHTVRRDPA
jgi:hypothetical protein